MRSALIILALAALGAAQLSAQSTNGTLAATDPSFTHPGSPMLGGAGGPKYYEALEFNVSTTGNYTFSYTTTGYQGAMYLYQGAFLPSSPIANIWSWGAVTGNPVTEVHNLSVTGKFVLVLTSTATSATGTWSLSISGPGTLQMGPNVKSVSPSSGSTGGGTSLTISGDFFTGVTSVTIGGASVTSLSVVNSTTITCTSPPGAAGAADVFASNPAGFGLTNTLGSGYTYVSTPTSVSSINRQTPSGTTTNQASVVFRVTFAASVGGVSTSNFSVSGVTGASVTGVSGSGTTRDITVNTGSGDGTIRLDMANATGVTPGLTNVPFTSGQSYTIDKTAPTVSSITLVGASPTNAASVQFTVTFSESVSGVATANLSLDTTGVTGPSITSVSAGPGTTRTVTVNTGTGNGTVSIDLLTLTPAITDTAGNNMAAAFINGSTYTIDKTAPTVSSIVRVGATPTNATSVQFTVTFSESVTGVATGNFTLNTTGVTGASVTSVSAGPGTTRTVTVNTGTGSGTISLELSSATPAVPDLAGNNLTATFNTGEVYTIDKTAPTIAIGTPTPASSVAGPVDFTITYGGADAVTLAVGNITLNTTGTATGTVGVSGSGLTTRTVSVTGISGVGTIGISIAAGTASDTAGNSAAAAGPSATATITGVIGPEMDVDRGGPLASGGTDTVTGATALSAVTLTYTINNSGNQPLTITTPVAAPGAPSNCIASITTQPTSPVAASGNTTLVVSVTPAAAGLFTCTISIGNNDTTGGENPYTWTISGTAAPAQPEMDVTRGATPVANGVPDALGNIASAVAQTVTYTITNSGLGTLNLTGAPDLVTATAGTNVTSATVTTPPASATVASAASVTFVVTYTITANGAFSFTINIPNNDSNEAPYAWTVSGTGVSAPEMDVSRSAAVISGGTDALGNATIGVATSLTYTIANTGNQALTLTLPVSITNMVNCTATVTTAPGVSVAASANATMVIDVTPTAAGAFSFDVSIANDDPNENPYTWSASGTGTSASGGGGGKKNGEDEKCSASESGKGLLMLAGLLALGVVGVRMRRRYA